MSERVAINVIHRSSDDLSEEFSLDLEKLFPIEQFTNLSYRLVHFKRDLAKSSFLPTPMRNEMCYIQVDVFPRRKTIFNGNVVDNLLWISSDDKVFDGAYYPIFRKTKTVKILIPEHYKECIIEFSADKVPIVL